MTENERKRNTGLLWEKEIEYNYERAERMSKIFFVLISMAAGMAISAICELAGIL